MPTKVSGKGGRKDTKRPAKPRREKQHDLRGASLKRAAQTARYFMRLRRDRAFQAQQKLTEALTYDKPMEGLTNINNLLSIVSEKASAEGAADALECMATALEREGREASASR